MKKCSYDKKNKEIKFKLSDKEQIMLKNKLTEGEESYKRELDEINRKYSIKCLNIMYPFKNNIPAIRNVVIMNKYLFTKGIFKNYEHFKLEFEEMGIYKYNIIISSLIDPTKSIGVSENDLKLFLLSEY